MRARSRSRSLITKRLARSDDQDMLNQHPALLKATKFVGQSQGKQENDKGFKQSDQKKVK